MRIYENHVSVTCGLGNEYESDVQGSSENKAGFQFLTGLVFFCQALFSLHFLNRYLHRRLSYIHNHFFFFFFFFNSISLLRRTLQREMLVYLQ